MHECFSRYGGRAKKRGERSQTSIMALAMIFLGNASITIAWWQWTQAVHCHINIVYLCITGEFSIGRPNPFSFFFSKKYRYPEKTNSMPCSIGVTNAHYISYLLRILTIRGAPMHSSSNIRAQRQQCPPPSQHPVRWERKNKRRQEKPPDHHHHKSDMTDFTVSTTSLTASGAAEDRAEAAGFIAVL